MCTQWPLSKSSTLRGCCQGSSVIFNGWLFPKTPSAWSRTDWEEEEVFSRLLFLALPVHPSLPHTQQVLSDGSRAWLAPATSGAECCPSAARLAGQCHSSGRGQGAGSSVLLSPAQRNNSGSAKPPPPRHFLLPGRKKPPWEGEWGQEQPWELSKVPRRPWASSRSSGVGLEGAASISPL